MRCRVCIWIMALDLLLVVVDSGLWGFTLYQFLLFEKVDKNVKKLEEIARESKEKAESLEPFETFDGDDE